MNLTEVQDRLSKKGELHSTVSWGTILDKEIKSGIAQAGIEQVVYSSNFAENMKSGLITLVATAAGASDSSITINRPLGILAFNILAHEGGENAAQKKASKRSPAFS